MVLFKQDNLFSKIGILLIQTFNQLTLFLFILVLTKGVEYVQFMMQNKRPIVLESQNVDISNFKLFVPLVIIVSRNLNF